MKTCDKKVKNSNCTNTTEKYVYYNKKRVYKRYYTKNWTSRLARISATKWNIKLIAFSTVVPRHAIKALHNIGIHAYAIGFLREQ